MKKALLTGFVIVVIIVVAGVFGGKKKEDPHEGQHCVHSNDVTGECDEWADDEPQE